jgi:quinol-cytochrome oxidoreductase complex cytochrome b subunit
VYILHINYRYKNSHTNPDWYFVPLNYFLPQDLATDISMKTKTLTLLIRVLLAWARRQTEETDPVDNPVETLLKGSVLTDQTIESQVLGGPQHYAIYLPPGYNTSRVDYPVLYLLHGMWGTYLDRLPFQSTPGSQ